MAEITILFSLSISGGQTTVKYMLENMDAKGWHHFLSGSGNYSPRWGKGHIQWSLHLNRWDVVLWSGEYEQMLYIIWKRPVIAEQNCIIDACGKLLNCLRKYRLYCCCWEDMKWWGRWGKMIGKWCKPDLNLRCLHESQCIGTYALTPRHWPSWIHCM